MTQKKLLCLLSLVLLVACGPAKDKVRIEGKFKNLQNAEFYLYAAESAFDGIDTVRIERGKFKFERTLAEPTIFTMLYPNFSRSFFVAEPGQTIDIAANAEHLDEIAITGNDANERLTKFRREISERKESDRRLAAAQYVRDNAKTLDGTAVFLQFFAEDKQPADDVLPLLDVLQKAQPEDPLMTALDARLRPLLKTAVGADLPAFALTTLDGRTLTNADFRGKPLLIVFCAHWQGDSRHYLDRVRRIREAFPGRLGVLAISLDTSKKTCRQMDEINELGAPIVCDELSFLSPVVETLGVRFVPGCILTTADGKVVGRDFTADELEDEVAKLLN